MSELFVSVVSITRTQRGRFFWAAWWSSPPSHHPFRAPDASNGGSETREAAREEAERIAGKHLVEIEPYWARACIRSMRGLLPFSPSELVRAASGERRIPKVRSSEELPRSSWAVLGVGSQADALEIKRAFRKRALETHPDHGGDPDDFRAVKAAYEKVMLRKKKNRGAKKRHAR